MSLIPTTNLPEIGLAPEWTPTTPVTTARSRPGTMSVNSRRSTRN
jgi:hypothetical protein